ncbi:hypothetical protein WJ86_04795 [Burkholderia multivorans]|nr:hypothetical protein WJ86_04795 [Burkholderia multivorans]KWA36014.1 hypothetical protein WL27_03170 [Burkholderia multivorans]
MIFWVRRLTIEPRQHFLIAAIENIFRHIGHYYGSNIFGVRVAQQRVAGHIVRLVTSRCIRIAFDTLIAV